ncbi:hypothetical protein AB9T89_16180 [Flavobacterium oncorhynchi]|uniref:hypothetical protein n=2 Tax=Flavobacterium TaxID=237 RepID=UPI00351A0AD8
MSENHRKVECSNHGLRNNAFVCQHLVNSEFPGFWEPFDSDSTKEYDDGELNAWCDKCDKILVEQGEWNDVSEEFAQIQLICEVCFFELKELNRGSSNYYSK